MTPPRSTPRRRRAAAAGGSAVLTAPGRPKPAPRPARVPVLVLLHPDGAVEVYADRARVALAVGELLAVDPVNEPAAERYVELLLPRSHRGLWLPGNLLGRGVIRPRTVEDEARRRWELDVLTELRDIRAELTKGKE